MTHFNDNDFPSLRQVTKFLDRQTNNATKREKQSSFENKSERYVPPHKTKRRDNSSAKALMLSSKKFYACQKESHKLYQCSECRNMSVYDRADLVRNTELCPKFLKKHGKRECTFGRCPVCNKPHISLLHFPNSKSKKNETSKSIFSTTSKNSKELSSTAST